MIVYKTCAGIGYRFQADHDMSGESYRFQKVFGLDGFGAEGKWVYFVKMNGVEYVMEILPKDRFQVSMLFGDDRIEILSTPKTLSKAKQFIASHFRNNFTGSYVRGLR